MQSCGRWARTIAFVCVALMASCARPKPYPAAPIPLRSAAPSVPLPRLGFAIPKVAEADQRSLILLVRVTPGPPFIVQNYLLGLARVDFPSYLAISWVVNSLQCGAMIVCGDALAQGQGKGAMLAVSLLAAFAIGVRWLRQYLQRKKLSAAA